MADVPPEAPLDDTDDDADDESGLMDKLRGSGLGTEDPNIVGDVGPTDIPPGTDGDAIREASAPPPPPAEA